MSKIITKPVRFVKLHPDAKVPEYKTSEAAGMDLHICERAVLTPGERKTVTTGLNVNIPSGFVGFVCPRSGLAHKHGLTVVNAPGVIDSDYTGELKVILLNTGNETLTFMCPDRIAQLVIVPVIQAPVLEVNNFEDKETARGEKGFGSTGV